MKRLESLLYALERLYSVRTYDQIVELSSPLLVRAREFCEAAEAARRCFVELQENDYSVLLCLDRLLQVRRWELFVEPSVRDGRPIQDDEVWSASAITPEDPMAILEAMAMTKQWSADIRDQIGASPRVLLLSSSENLKILEEVQRCIPDEFEVSSWKSVEALPIGQTVLESLVRATYHFDFGVFLLTPDDVRVSRERRTAVPRDNVIFELGLFLGLSSTRRAFVLRPRDGTTNFNPLSLPSDLEGVVSAMYDPEDQGENGLHAACNAIVASMRQVLRCRMRAVV